MKITFFSLLILTAFCSCSQTEQRIPLNSSEFSHIIKVLESGTWIWHEGKCEENRQSFNFNIENKSVTLSLAEPVGVNEEITSSYTYEILWAWSEGFRGKIIGEKRLDDNGEPVEWDLVLIDNKSFYWRRNDWNRDGGTNLNRKCP